MLLVIGVMTHRLFTLIDHVRSVLDLFSNKLIWHAKQVKTRSKYVATSYVACGPCCELLGAWAPQSAYTICSH